MTTTLALTSLTLSACQLRDPVVNTPDDRPLPNRSVFADVVLQITRDGATTPCTEDGGIPICGTAPRPQGSLCENNPALGQPDGVFFDLGPGDVIDLGFLCNFIVEVGLDVDPVTKESIPSPDFRIIGRVEDGARPVVEVSLDGTTYVAVDPWAFVGKTTTYAEDPGFLLEFPMLPEARFVRITENAGRGRIRIDAIEAFPFVSTE